LNAAVLALGDETSSNQTFEVVVDEVGVLETWMSAHGFAAALVRPDKYAYGGANSRQSLSELLRSLHSALFAPGEDPRGSSADETSLAKRSIGI
jgi:hypothetical protein